MGGGGLSEGIFHLLVSCWDVVLLDQNDSLDYFSTRPTASFKNFCPAVENIKQA